MYARRGVACLLTAGVVLGTFLLGRNTAIAQEPVMASVQGDDVASLSAATTGPVMGKEIVVSAIDNQQLWPAVAYNKKRREYLVVWQNSWTGNRDIYGQRISAQGQLISWFTIATGGYDRAQPSVAYDPVNDRYLVTWVYDVNGNSSNWDVYGRLVPWNGPDPSLSEFAICDWPTRQWNPKLAYGRAQQEFFVVWWTESLVPGYVGGRRIAAATGAPVDKAFAIAHHASENRVSPDIAYNLSRNEYLIVYDNGLDIFGTRLQGDGTILGGEFGIAGWPDAEVSPAIASCEQADQYLVAWQSLQQGVQNNVYARFVAGDGTPDSVHHMYGLSVHQEAPDVICTGQLYLVSWEQQYSNLTGPFGIWGRMISTQKQMMDPIALVSPTVGVQAEFSRPAAAGGPAQYLTVWEHDRAGGSYQDIHGRIAIPYVLYIPIFER